MIHSAKEKSILGQQTPSPLPRKSANNKSAYRDFGSDLETLFVHSEYNKAMELLANVDYKKPNEVSDKKFVNWLTIAHRVRDNQFNEVLNKLKILITFSDKNEEEDDQNLDDSLDNGSI